MYVLPELHLYHRCYTIIKSSYHAYTESGVLPVIISTGTFVVSKGNRQLYSESTGDKLCKCAYKHTYILMYIYIIGLSNSSIVRYYHQSS